MKFWPLLFCLLLPGCSGVMLNAQYTTLLDKTAALSQDTANRAVAGQLTEAQKTQALVGQAAVWQQFRAAASGAQVAPVPAPITVIVTTQP